MIGFLAPILLKLSPIGRVLKAIPRPVWIALAVLAVIGGAYWYHTDAVSDAREAGYVQGKADEGARIAKQALKLKAEIDALSGKISATLKDRNDETNRAIARDADDLRVRGPGKAACPRPASLPPAAGGHVGPGAEADVARGEVPIDDGLAAVPWNWLVTRAEQSDILRSEVLSWREWHRQQSEAWGKTKAP